MKFEIADLENPEILIFPSKFKFFFDQNLGFVLIRYFAPEIITAAGHNWNVDWWTLGIFIYELMAGKTPFHTPSQTEMYKKIVAGVDSKDFQWAGN